MAIKKGSRPRRIPRRTCVACRQERPKRELVRLVRTLAGPVETDPSGKKAGRGAYLCRYRDCWNVAMTRKVIEQALKTTISPENRAELHAYGAGLPERPPPSGTDLSTREVNP